MNKPKEIALINFRINLEQKEIENSFYRKKTHTRTHTNWKH